MMGKPTKTDLAAADRLMDECGCASWWPNWQDNPDDVRIRDCIAVEIAAARSAGAADMQERVAKMNRAVNRAIDILDGAWAA